MDSRLRRIADALAADAHSGASEMLRNAVASITAITDGEAIPTSDWKEFALLVHLAKPSIAPLFNIANTILLEVEGNGADAIRPALLKMAKREERSAEIIAREAEFITARWIVTSSYSSTVAAVIGALSEDRTLRVTVAESVPGGEGRAFAERLSQRGIETEIIPDSTVFARMAEADCALTGADSITPEGLVNKVGTRSLAEAANAHGRPAYAVCGWSKASPVVLSDLMASHKVLGQRLSEYVQIFESSPLELFTAIITESGALTPEDLRGRLQESRPADAWKELALLH